MAGARHTSTRREVLGGAVAVPASRALLPLGAAGPSTALRAVPLPQRAGGGSHERFARLLAAYEGAAVAVGRFEAWARTRSHDEQMRLDDAYGDILEVMYRALRRLLRAPAPDAAGFAAKVVLAIDHEVATLDGGEACMAALRRDAVRLSGAAGACGGDTR